MMHSEPLRGMSDIMGLNLVLMCVCKNITSASPLNTIVWAKNYV